jgi:hypothetical protein
VTVRTLFAQPSPHPVGLGLTDEAAHKVRVQLTH